MKENHIYIDESEFQTILDRIKKNKEAAKRYDKEHPIQYLKTHYPKSYGELSSKAHKMMNQFLLEQIFFKFYYDEPDYDAVNEFIQTNPEYLDVIHCITQEFDVKKCKQKASEFKEILRTFLIKEHLRRLGYVGEI